MITTTPELLREMLEDAYVMGFEHCAEVANSNNEDEAVSAANDLMEKASHKFNAVIERHK